MYGMVGRHRMGLAPHVPSVVARPQLCVHFHAGRAGRQNTDVLHLIL